MPFDLDDLDADARSDRFVLGQVGTAHGQLELEALTRIRQPAPLGDDEPGDRLVVAARQIVADEARDLVEVHVAVHDPRAVGVELGARPGLIVVLVADLADQLLGEVLDGDDADEPAVLVDDARELVARARQLLERVGHRHQVGHHERVAHDLAHRARVARLRAHHVGEVHHADRLLAVAEHRIAGVPARHERAQLADRDLGADDVDPHARHHGVLDVAMREVEDAVEQDRQLVGQVAARARVVDDVLEVLRRGARIDVVHRLDPDQPEHGVGRRVEQGDEPAEDAEVDLRRARQPAGERIGVRDRQVLGEELAEDHLRDRREREGEHGADRDADRLRHARDAEHGAERFADERLGDVAREQAGDRDAELRARQHERGAAGDGQRALGGRVAPLGLGAQACTVDRHVGELLRDEVAVRGDDQRREHEAREQQEQCADHERAGSYRVADGYGRSTGLGTVCSTPPAGRWCRRAYRGPLRMRCERAADVP
ncbi:hypothetical protein GCM10025877_23640 [Agromyces mangrovi Wang et al. 2018]|nr:hypothetical protein GCM10025877_23640 [Agromyces mangrovi]